MFKPNQIKLAKALGEAKRDGNKAEVERVFGVILTCEPVRSDGRAPAWERATYVRTMITFLSKSVEEYEKIAPRMAPLIEFNGIKNVVLLHHEIPMFDFFAATVLSKYALLTASNSEEEKTIREWRKKDLKDYRDVSH